MKRRVCEISLGKRGGSSYAKGGRGMRSRGPITSEIRVSQDWLRRVPTGLPIKN